MKSTRAWADGVSDLLFNLTMPIRRVTEGVSKGINCKVVLSLGARFLGKFISKTLRANKMDDMAAKIAIVKPYVPAFKLGIDHFFIHAGCRSVIDGTVILYLCCYYLFWLLCIVCVSVN